ncbi:MAG: cyclic nucleotide-binding domain-containing protein [Devosiaceae bacterium]|nr:cyclic nucleotide-binding domain-containing protein [Devosiaceae bacterium]
MELDETAHILGSADFFAICTLEQRRMLAFASELTSFKSGKTLFIAGEITSGAYVLISGELVLIKPTDSKEQELHVTEPGTVIGELALIAKHPRRATATCKTDVELLFVPRSAFAKLMKQFPDVAARAAELIRSNIGKYVGALQSTGVGAVTKR